MPDEVLVSIGAGEVDEATSRSTDLEIWRHTAREVKNFEIGINGDYESAPGTEYIGEAKYSNKKCRIQEFGFSVSETFFLEIGDQYIRVWKTDKTQLTVTSATAWATSTSYVVGNYVTESAVIYYCLEAHTSGTFATDLAANKWVAQTIFEMPTSYLEADLFELDIKPIKNIIYITHDEYPESLIKRYSTEDWRIEEVSYTNRLWGALNTTSTTLAASATTGSGVTLTASDDLFDATYVNSIFQLVHQRNESPNTLNCDHLYRPHLYDTSKIAQDGWTDLVTSPLNATDYTAIASASPVTFVHCLDNTIVGNLRPLYRCISDYTFSTDYVGGDDSPLDYPSNFTLGAIAVEQIQVDGTWQFVTDGSWSGEWVVEKSIDGGSTWFSHETFTSDNTDNFSYTGDESAIPGLLRLVLTKAFTNYTTFVKFTINTQNIYGNVTVTGYTNATTVTVTVNKDLNSTDATAIWQEEAFNERQGYATSTEVSESRRWVFGRDLVAGSKIEDYDNFQEGSTAAHAVKYFLSTSTQNKAKWIKGENRLHLGSEAEEFTIFALDNGIISPENDVSVRRQDSSGSNHIKAVLVGASVIFVSRNGCRVMRYSFNIQVEKYVSSWINTTSKDILGSSGVTQIAVQRDNIPRLYFVRGDGEIAVMTQINVAGRPTNSWYRLTTDGSVESLAVNYGTGADEVWMSVKRNINGADVRYIERVRRSTATDSTDWWYLDCAKLTTGSDLTSITGLSHLEGETVNVWADGKNIGQKTVSSGAITIEASDKILVGLKKEQRMSPRYLDYLTNRGTTRTGTKNVETIHFNLQNSSNFKVKIGDNEPKEVKALEEITPGEAITPFNGSKTVYLEGNPSKDINIQIQNDEPTRVKVNSMTVNYK